MAKAVKQLSEKLRHADGLIEVRDARIPLSSRSLSLPTSKPRVIVLNKSDLVAKSLHPKIKAAVLRNEVDALEVLMVSSTRRRRVGVLWDGIEQVGRRVQERGEGFRTTGALLYVVGVPNVGKSTVINAIRDTAKRRGAGARDGKRSRKGAMTGGVPGVTRQVSSMRISSDPPVFLGDSPGILLPNLDDQTAALRLGICGCLPDTAVDAVDLAAQLLTELKKYRKVPDELHCIADTQKEFSLINPMDILERLGIEKYGTLQAGGIYDPDATAKRLLKSFRDGRLGHICLDDLE